MITRLIREAGSEQEIFLLLAAYVEATRLHAKVRNRLTRGTGAPLGGLDVVKKWIEALFYELGAASTGLDDSSRMVVKEALYVFGEALMRLEAVSANGTELLDAGLHSGEANDTRETYAVHPRPDAPTPISHTPSSLASPVR